MSRLLLMNTEIRGNYILSDQILYFEERDFFIQLDNPLLYKTCLLYFCNIIQPRSTILTHFLFFFGGDSFFTALSKSLSKNLS